MFECQISLSYLYKQIFFIALIVIITIFFISTIVLKIQRAIGYHLSIFEECFHHETSKIGKKIAELFF